MTRRYSQAQLEELHASVKRALERDGTVNVSAIAWELKERFNAGDAGLPELEAQVMAVGLAMRAAMFFERPARHEPQLQPVLGSRALETER